MNFEKGTLESEFVCAAVVNGALLSYNELSGFRGLQSVESFARSLVRAAIKYGIFPDELKCKSLVAAEMKAEAEAEEIKRKQAEVDSLKKEVEQLKSEVVADKQ